MNKQEAIALVRELWNFMATRPEIDEAVNMAIEALTSQNLTEPNNACEVDLISRQAVIDALYVLCQEHRYKIPGEAETYSQYNEAWQDALDRAEEAIGNLPSAQPERKKGEWIEDGYNNYKAVCNECGEPCGTYVMGKPRDNFCKWCGADLRHREENNDDTNA